MPPRPPAENAPWSAKLALLRERLGELDASMQAGRWESFALLAELADQAMRELRAHPGAPAPGDAASLRQTLDLAHALQARAAARRQQILPLLTAWKRTTGATTRSDEPTP